MTSPTPRSEIETRIGVDIQPGRVAAIALDERDPALSRVVAPGLGAALAGLGVADPRLVMLDAGSIAADALERGRVARVAVVRLGAPLTLAVPPLATWPGALSERVCAGTAVVAGGADLDGSATPLDADAIARFLEDVRPAAVAVTGLFSPVAPEQELAAAAVVQRTLGAGVPVALSHELGTLGLLERENAAVLNAALAGVLDGLAATLREAAPAAEGYVARGDGTLIELTHALRLPVTAIGSGSACALRGAFRLTGIDDAIVAIAEPARMVVGALRHGLPRRVAGATCVAGIPVALGLPDIRAVAGPGELAAAVASLAAGARRPVVVAVGGAAERVPRTLDGVGYVIHPPDGELAGAIGAASGLVGGEAECICPDRPEPRRIALREASAAACERAIHLGAEPGSVTVVDIEETSLAALPEPSIRIHVRAAGPP